MSRNCSVGYYPTSDVVTMASICRLLLCNGYAIMGDDTHDSFAYFSYGDSIFCIDLSQDVTQGMEPEQAALMPDECHVCMVVHFDRPCLLQVLDLLAKLIQQYGGIVIEGLGLQATAYTLDDIRGLPDHPVWSESEIEL